MNMSEPDNPTPPSTPILQPQDLDEDGGRQFANGRCWCYCGCRAIIQQRYYGRCNRCIEIHPMPIIPNPNRDDTASNLNEFPLPNIETPPVFLLPTQELPIIPGIPGHGHRQLANPGCSCGCGCKNNVLRPGLQRCEYCFMQHVGQ